jgi:hypothetical protein
MPNRKLLIYKGVSVVVLLPFGLDAGIWIRCRQKFGTWVAVHLYTHAGDCALASEGRQACPQSAMGSPCATHVLVANGIDTHIHFLFTARPDALIFYTKTIQNPYLD